MTEFTRSFGDRKNNRSKRLDRRVFKRQYAKKRRESGRKLETTQVPYGVWWLR